jgi:hypothetical protein
MIIEYRQHLVIGSGVAGKMLAGTLAAAPRQSGCSKPSGRVSRHGKCGWNDLIHTTSHLRRVFKEKKEGAP